MKIKVFTVTHSNEMEKCVNQWFAENPDAEIQEVRQSESMNGDSWSLTLSLIYLERGDPKIGFERAS
jgi:hypothetical protein